MAAKVMHFYVHMFIISVNIHRRRKVYQNLLVEKKSTSVAIVFIKHINTY